MLRIARVCLWQVLKGNWIELAFQKKTRHVKSQKLIVGAYIQSILDQNLCSVDQQRHVIKNFVITLHSTF